MSIYQYLICYSTYTKSVHALKHEIHQETHLHTAVSVGVPLRIQPCDDDRHLEAVLVTGQTDAQPFRALVQPHVVKFSVLPVLALNLA